MSQGRVRKIVLQSQVDGVGNRMVFFFQGCNLNCLFCHNPETIDFKDNDVKIMDVEDVLAHVTKYKDFIRGVTFSGGECTQQMVFLIEASIAIKSMGLEVLVDTNGLMDSNAFVTLSHVVDGYLFDIKSLDPREHLYLTGGALELILANMTYGLEHHLIKEVRSVIVPIVINNYRNVMNVSKLTAHYDQKLPYKIIGFRKNGVIGSLSTMPSPSMDYLLDLKKVANANGLENVIVI